MEIDVDVIRTMRHLLGMSQEQLAEKAGLSKRGLEYIVRRRSAQPQSVNLIADALGTTVERLKRRPSAGSAPPPPLAAPARTSAPPPSLLRWICPVGQCGHRPEFRYAHLFEVCGLQVAYIPFLDGWRSEGRDVLHVGDIQTSVAPTSPFRLPDELRRLPCPPIAHDGVKVRLVDHTVSPQADIADRHTLRLAVERAAYSDQIRVSRHLDDPFPGASDTTYRDRYAPTPLIGRHRLPEQLANQCGVGLFLLINHTGGRRTLIYSRQEATQTLSAGLYSYSASGSMDWDDSAAPHPAVDVGRECRQETGWEVQAESLRLIGFGLDTKDLYVQFSFVEEVAKSHQEICELLEGADHAEDSFEQRVYAADFTPKDVAEILTQADWEPPAGAALLTLAIRSFGRQEVGNAMNTALAERAECDKNPGEECGL